MGPKVDGAIGRAKESRRRELIRRESSHTRGECFEESLAQDTNLSYLQTSGWIEIHRLRDTRNTTQGDDNMNSTEAETSSLSRKRITKHEVKLTMFKL